MRRKAGALQGICGMPSPPRRGGAFGGHGKRRGRGRRRRRRRVPPCRGPGLPGPSWSQPARQRVGSTVRGGGQCLGRRRHGGAHRHQERLGHHHRRRPRHGARRVQPKVPDGRLCPQKAGRPPIPRGTARHGQEGHWKPVALLGGRRDRGAHGQAGKRRKVGLCHGLWEDQAADRQRKQYGRAASPGSGRRVRNRNRARHHDPADRPEEADRRGRKSRQEAAGEAVQHNRP